MFLSWHSETGTSHLHYSSSHRTTNRMFGVLPQHQAQGLLRASGQHPLKRRTVLVFPLYRRRCWTLVSLGSAPEVSQKTQPLQALLDCGCGLSPVLSSLFTVVTHLIETVSRENVSGLLVLDVLTTKEAKAWWNSFMAVAVIRWRVKGPRWMKKRPYMY